MSDQAVFIQVPANAILCHYAQLESGEFAVVAVSGKVLASSFYELREQFEASATINGAGSWVVLVPRSSSSSQLSLF